MISRAGLPGRAAKLVFSGDAWRQKRTGVNKSLAKQPHPQHPGQEPHPMPRAIRSQAEVEHLWLTRAIASIQPVRHQTLISVAW